jgi:Dolichyl-phosphate-mannose-protein mannosyltransferase/Aminoarabinose transferase C-terminal domain
MIKRDSWARDLPILSLFFGVLFGFKLGERALWSPVEGHYSEIAREMVVSGDYLTPWLAGMKYLEKPPLFYWLESANINLFGLSEWSLRLWPAVFGTIGCLAVYFAGSRLFESRVGLISSAVLATSALWYGMGHVINLDMAVSTLITCALLSFLVGSVEQPGYKRRFAMWAFFVFSALATLTKGLIGIVIPAMVIGTWVLILDEWNILTTLYLPSGVSLFLLIAAPWHVLISRANPDFLRSYLFDEHFQRYLTKPEGPFEQPWAYIPVLLLGMFPWAVFMLQALRHSLRFPWRQRHQHKEVIFLVLWAGLVFLFFSVSSFKGVPYILPVLPPLAILIARYIAAAWESPRVSGVQSGSFALLVALSLLVIAGLAGPQHYLERYSNWPDVEVPRAEATVVSTRGEYGDLSALTPYIHAQSVILIVGAVSALILSFGNRRAFRWGFLSLTLAWALFLVVLNSSLTLLDQRRSVKALATVLKSQLHPSDEVASYHAYYQDLPVYLQRPIAVVGWKGNLQFGVEVNERSGGWMTDDDSFWKRWNSPATVYMLTEETTYEKLRSESSFKFRVVAQGLYDVLLSNKTT